jgi:hypothetical protein
MIMLNNLLVMLMLTGEELFTIENLICFKYFGATISWTSRKQSMVTLSSTEAEYIALVEAAQEALWIMRMLKDLNQELTGPVVIYEDNQSCIKMLKSDRCSPRTKHIATKYHFVRELFKSGTIDIKSCPSETMIADLLTKPLGPIKIKQFAQDIGLI